MKTRRKYGIKSRRRWKKESNEEENAEKMRAKKEKGRLYFQSRRNNVLTCCMFYSQVVGLYSMGLLFGHGNVDQYSVFINTLMFWKLYIIWIVAVWTEIVF